MPMPEASGGFTLQRVLLGYSLTDPAMPAGYATRLVPLGPAWAAALGLSPEEQDAPQTTALPDLVNEGADYKAPTRRRCSRATATASSSTTEATRARPRFEC